jgi:LCP family protein required for cell wall assembly
MSNDWDGWYQGDKPASDPAFEQTRDYRVQAPGGARPAGWPTQPPGKSGSAGRGGDGPAYGVPGNSGTGYGVSGNSAPGNTGTGQSGTGYDRTRFGGAGNDGAGYGRPGGGRRGWRRWMRPKRILLILGALVVVLAILGTYLYFNVNGKLNRANVLTAYNGRPAPTAGTNWLITGSDSRGGLTRAQEAQLALGHDVAGGRSDTIMVLHIPANGDPPVLVSIPRDSYVPIPGYGWNKINAAYALGGPKLLAETVQNVTGLYINHYLGIGLGGLVDSVNAVGGVRLCLPAAVKDPLAGLNLPKGCQNLNGGQVLSFVRTRNFPLGDLQREEDQRLLLSALLKKMTSAGVLFNPFAIIPAANSIAATLDVDPSVQLLDLYSVGQALRSPVSTSVPFGSFQNTSAGSVIRWDSAKALQLFSDLAKDKPVPKSLLSGTSLQGTA